MSTTETWRTEAATRIERRHFDVIQDHAERAGEYVEWLQSAAMKEDAHRIADFARNLRDDMNAILERTTRLDAIKDMREIYEAEALESLEATGEKG